MKVFTIDFVMKCRPPNFTPVDDFWRIYDPKSEVGKIGSIRLILYFDYIPVIRHVVFVLRYSE